mmetsp:Transcript_9266/g.22295  ORF Transcript_9266/g.22295 Transcript_9266/m.22295 type:complete len:233 (-) Transcript_9266:211-909(-)
MRLPVHQRGSDAHVEAVGPHLGVARHAIEDVVSSSPQRVLQQVVAAVHSKEIHARKLGGQVDVVLRKPHMGFFTVGAEHATDQTLSRLDSAQLCHILIVLGNLERHVFGQVDLAGMDELLNVSIAVAFPRHNLHVAFQARKDGILIFDSGRKQNDLVSKLRWGVPQQELSAIWVNPNQVTSPSVDQSCILESLQRVGQVVCEPQSVQGQQGSILNERVPGIARIDDVREVLS